MGVGGEYDLHWISKLRGPVLNDGIQTSDKGARALRTSSHGIGNPMRGTDGCPWQKDRILFDQGDCSGLHIISRGLDIIQRFRNIKYDSLRLWASQKGRYQSEIANTQRLQYLGLDWFLENFDGMGGAFERKPRGPGELSLSLRVPAWESGRTTC